MVLTTGPLVGLGDGAIYSTLPKRFAELGYTVVIDKDCAARNDDTLEALWLTNPHIAGKSDKKPNAGYVRQGLFYEIANRFPIGSIEAMERAHGLPPPYSIAPIFNYPPSGYPLDLKNTVLMDFSSVSSKIAAKGVQDFVDRMIQRFAGCQFMQIVPPRWASLEPPMVAGPGFEVSGIREYLDALRGARAWIGSEAGGQSMAAAVRGEHDVYDLEARPEVVVLSTPKTYNSKGYCFRGVNYHVSRFAQDTDSDWWSPHEVNEFRYTLQCSISLMQMRNKQIA